MASSLFGANRGNINPTSPQRQQNGNDETFQKIGEFLGYINGKDPKKLLSDYMEQHNIGQDEYNAAMEKARKYAPIVEMFLQSRK